MTAAYRNFSLADGRTLEALVAEEPADVALVCHHGTPSEGGMWRAWADVAAENGVRLVAPTRPGYAGSSRLPGRRVLDVAADVRELLDQLGAPVCYALGWSGGGPHAIACALLGERCRGVATIAGVGPGVADDLDFTAGMGPENVAEFAAASAGEAALREWLDRNAGSQRHVTAAEIGAALGGLVGDVDRAALADGQAEVYAETIRRALAPGWDGWVDDDLAFGRSWGIPRDAISMPLTLWQGDRDLMVPFAHGEWLAKHMPGARTRWVPGHGHLSLIALRETIVAELVGGSDERPLPPETLRGD